MKHDSQVAIALIGLSVLLLIPSVRSPLLGLVSNPVVAILFIGAAATILLRGYTLVAIVMIAAALYLSRESMTVAKSSQPVYFAPTESEPQDGIDVQIANRTVKLQVPEFPVEEQPQLLTYPPTEETLRSMTGA
jgi:hypothetical protein